MTRNIIFDIEADGLVATKIHCLSYYDYIKNETISLTTYEEIRSFVLRKDIVLIGHNIERYDIPTLERILDIEITCRRIDTLAISFYLYPKLDGSHGLEAWGNRLGFEKPKIDDWENLSIEEYVHRCESDVEINKRLYDKQLVDLKPLYEDSTEIQDYLTFKFYCIALQEKYRWKLDLDKCIESLTRVQKECDSIEKVLCKIMPKIPVNKTINKPTSLYKKNGELSVRGEKWLNFLAEHGISVDTEHTSISYTASFLDPKPTSSIQVKDWLTELGWKPRTFKYDKNKDTGKVRKIPQIKNGKFLCDSVKELIPIEDNIKYLEKYTILNSKKSFLKGLRDCCEDGHVQASVSGFTNTMRFKHVKPLTNIPGVVKKAPWYSNGALIRELLTCEEDEVLCGSDMCSLEDTTKQHYMWDYDPEYVTEMQHPDYDPHLDITVLAGYITPEQAQAHKDGKEDHGALRKKGKMVNFAAVYGVGASTLSRNSGNPESECRELLDIYWKRNWAVRKVAANVEVKTIKGQMWAKNPISSFWYSLRYEKDIFSTINQG